VLDKYTWLKDAHAQLEKKQADIKVYGERTKSLEGAYDGKPRSAWAREDREQWSTWQSEVAGVKASYNDLAARYNAKMAEVQWRFTNVGTLPQGATEPLPREYAAYEEK
jgi:two-component SAPR family response regulator